MRNRGLANPAMGAIVSALLLLASAAALWWGISQAVSRGEETSATAIMTAMGGLIGFFALIYLANCLWALRLVSAIHRGKGVIGHWIVAPATFELFRDQEKRFAGTEEENDYPLPRRTPREGLPVWFTEDGVLIGDRFFGLSSTGLSRFESVHLRRGVPSCIEFQTVMTSVGSPSRVSVRHHRGRLRVPIGSSAANAASRVLDHFTAVMARRVIVKPGFWTARIRIGIGGTVLGGLSFAAGMLLRERNSELMNIPLGMAVTGAIVAIAGVLVFILSSAQYRRQRHG